MNVGSHAVAFQVTDSKPGEHLQVVVDSGCLMCRAQTHEKEQHQLHVVGHQRTGKKLQTLYNAHFLHWKGTLKHTVTCLLTLWH